MSFGEFFMGSSQAADPRYSPSICSPSHGDGHDFPGSTIGRYRSREGALNNGYFGCREWAAQLYDAKRPYIDVTSYEMEEDLEAPVKKGKKPPQIPVARVRPFIGFSRFDSPAKPVIGNNRGQWYCFTDCPNGEAPGQIDDMPAWVKRNGWPMPKKPKDPWAFRDRPVKAEDFED